MTNSIAQSGDKDMSLPGGVHSGHKDLVEHLGRIMDILGHQDVPGHPLLSLPIKVVLKQAGVARGHVTYRVHKYLQVLK